MNGQDQVVGRGTDFACAEFDHGEIHGSGRGETLTELGVGGGIAEVDGALLTDCVANHTRGTEEVFPGKGVEPTFTVQEYGLILNRYFLRKSFSFGDDFVLGPGGAGEGEVTLLEGFGLVGVADIQDELFFTIMELAGGICGEGGKVGFAKVVGVADGDAV